MSLTMDKLRKCYDLLKDSVMPDPVCDVRYYPLKGSVEMNGCVMSMEMFEKEFPEAAKLLKEKWENDTNK